MAAWMTAKSDPDFSRTMQWMWASEDYPAGGADWRLGGYEPYAFDRCLPARAPAWGSELFPNLGLFARAAFDTPHESYLIFLSHTDPLRNLDVWTPGIGGISQWFGRGKPLSTCFNLDTGYAVRHELLRDGVRLARNWGEPGDPKAPFGHYVVTTPEAVSLQSPADYVRSSFSYTKVDDRDWFPNPPPPAYPRVTPTTQPKLEWTRQLLVVKDSDPAGPAYVVLRDTTRGGQPTAWQFWTLSEKIGTPEQVYNLDAFLADKPGEKLLPARELPAGDAIQRSVSSAWTWNISWPARPRRRATRSAMAGNRTPACPNTKTCCTCNCPATVTTSWFSSRVRAERRRRPLPLWQAARR